MAARVAAATLIAAITLFAVAASADAAKKKKPTRYAATTSCAPVKPLSADTEPSSGSVTRSLPAPPPGQKWRVAFAVNTNGFVVRIFLGDDQVGSGLIRWDRSYRLDLGIKGLDIAGSPVDISGRLEGCDINDKDPITEVRGKLDGPLELADGITLVKGDLVWDHDGMRIDGDARIRCTSGGTLKGTALIEYSGPQDWTLHILGSTEGPTCVMEGDFAISDATIGGTITAKGGIVDGKITGRANVSAPELPFGPWAATFQLLLTGPQNRIAVDFSADAESEAGYAKVTTGPDGELVITLNLKGSTTSEGETVPSTEGGYVDPASLLPLAVPAGAGARHAAKLKVDRVRVLRSKRMLDVLAPITGRASGDVDVRFLAAGRTTTFKAEVDAGARRVRFTHAIASAQARLGTGIVTLRYRGDGDTLPQTVRLRAAARKAELDARRPAIRDGRLTASGTISTRARGVVRVRLVYETADGPVTREYRARISKGRYRLSTKLPDGVSRAIAARRGVVHSSTLFTGYLGARMRGEMASHQIMAAP